MSRWPHHHDGARSTESTHCLGVTTRADAAWHRAHIRSYSSWHEEEGLLDLGTLVPRSPVVFIQKRRNRLVRADRAGLSCEVEHIEDLLSLFIADSTEGEVVEHGMYQLPRLFGPLVTIWIVADGLRLAAHGIEANDT